MAEFAKTFKIPENVAFTFNGDTVNVVQEYAFRMAERWDNAFIEEIRKEAVVSGFTEVTVMNKKEILNALEKQIPKTIRRVQRFWRDGKPKNKDNYCPVCGKQQKMSKGDEWYCERCGQKLTREEQHG